jgi:hypothetical protein
MTKPASPSLAAALSGGSLSTRNAEAPARPQIPVILKG